MTLFIQRAGHRDTQAIHAKLDELLRVEGRARSELSQLDDEEPEVIEKHRAEERDDPAVKWLLMASLMQPELVRGQPQQYLWEALMAEAPVPGE
jgi:low affinity Fe/Cu permease